jgi:hypothetical protein
MRTQVLAERITLVERISREGLHYHRDIVSIWEGSEDTATSERALTVT